MFFNMLFNNMFRHIIILVLFFYSLVLFSQNDGHSNEVLGKNSVMLQWVMVIITPTYHMEL